MSSTLPPYSILENPPPYSHGNDAREGNGMEDGERSLTHVVEAGANEEYVPGPSLLNREVRYGTMM